MIEDEREAPATPRLTPSDELILDWLRSGLVDAEIAVRLGISNAEVKDRVERLVSRMGVRHREDLRWNRQPTRTAAKPGEDSPKCAEPVVEPRRAWKPGPAVMLVVAVAGAAGMVWYGFKGRSPTDEDFPSEDLAVELDALGLAELIESGAVHLAPTAAERFNGLALVPTATPTRTPTTVLRTGEPMLDAGRVFVVDGQASAISSTEETERGLQVTLSGQGIFRFENTTVAWIPQPSGPGERNFGARIGNAFYELHVEPGDEWTDFLYGDWDTFGIFSRGTGPPVVVISVKGSRVEAEGGHLYIAEDSR